jgi:hypothetical protein
MASPDASKMNPKLGIYLKRRKIMTEIHAEQHGHD